ncbi:SDR family NAD(P)-dependent oxidoreductase [Magnetofaba australis]|uniref:Putative short-chain dehydrogenase/reductase SDR n=1 Tax=Magnetofaba australis IT-1 TaxID=1434232 RepID=A0A1Y2K1B6_9PROT|nr:SDR family NAD(P)-dependent oxidoreductase [Magnetofaba australis]OSM01467.1 putative short-chain dehydrogenase/reductase SDR [Magnetofaba australis IT-1]
MLLQDRIALVTGAGSGIGLAVAKAYAREGATVLLLGRDQSKLETAFDAITAAGGSASIAPVDLENELGAVPQLVKGVHERYGKLDILVNNAGQLGVMTPLAAYDPVKWEQVMRVNLTAPFFLTRELMPLLAQSDNAAVINVVSTVAFAGRAYWGAYAASKAALANLTETWAGELQKTAIRMNTVNPGGTATAMRAAAFPGEDPESIPSAEQIAPVFLYLASEHSKERGQHLKARDWMDWRAP